VTTSSSSMNSLMSWYLSYKTFSFIQNDIMGPMILKNLPVNYEFSY
jgi:hypothetical protein